MNEANQNNAGVSAPRFGRIGAAAGLCLAVGAAGLIGCVAAGDSARAWGACLSNFVFWAGMGFGVVMVLAVSNLTAARWAGPVRSISKGFALFLPCMVLIFLVLLPVLSRVFPWVEKGAGHRAWWYSMTFLSLRDAAALVLLTGLGCWVVARSEKTAEQPRRISVIYGLAYALLMTLLAVDLILSRVPDWVSTLYPAYYFIGSFYSGLAVILLISTLVSRWPGMAVKADRFGDLSNLTLGFGLFTGYLFYTQVLVIWYGNLSMETEVLLRIWNEPGARALAIIVMGLCFALPLVVIAQRRLKRNPRVMFLVAALILVGMWLERFLLLAGGGKSTFPVGLAEISGALVFAGLLGGCVVLALRRTSRALGDGVPPELPGKEVN